MKKIKYIKYCLWLLLGVMILNSCKKDNNVAVKDVQFTVNVNSYVVTFNDSTTDAKSYLWTFGDGTTSTEASPVHTYSTKGKYVATLSATLNNGKVISGSTIIHISKSSHVILADSTFAAWDTISTAYKSTAAGGIAQMAKFDYDSNNIYIYMKIAGKVSDGTIFDFYLDTDGNTATGFNTWAFSNAGFDILLENAVLITPLFMYQHSGAQTAFSWNQLNTVGFYQLGAVVQSNGYVTFDMSISRTVIPGLSGKSMALGIILTKGDWSATVGYLPDPTTNAIQLNISQ